MLRIVMSAYGAFEVTKQTMPQKPALLKEGGPLAVEGLKQNNQSPLHFVALPPCSKGGYMTFDCVAPTVRLKKQGGEYVILDIQREK